MLVFFFFSSRRRHTRWNCDWSSDVCSSDLRTALHQGLTPAQWNDDRPTWDKYDKEMSTEVNDPKLAAEIKEYESRGYTAGTGGQTVEQLAELRELNAHGAKKYQFDRQEELLDVKARLGKIIQDTDFLRRFNKILFPEHRTARFTVGAAVVGGKWQYRVGITCLVATYEGGQFIGLGEIQPGLMPEYSVLRVDIHGIPLNAKWIGWRTVLMKAISLGAITEDQAHTEFGDPLGLASRRYREQLHAF